MARDFETPETKLNPSIFSSRRYVIKQLRKEVELVIQNFIKGKNYQKLIDQGCGVSPYKQLFKPHVQEYIGADIELNEYSQLLLNSDGKIPVPESTFDVVLSTQVLEHVEDPLEYLSESCRVLKKDGILILSTHGYWLFHPDPTDYWRWTSAGLRKIVEKNGFEIVSFRGIIGRSAVGLQLFQDGFVFKLPRIIILPLFAFFMQFFIWLTDKTTSQAVRNRDASIFILVARKK